MNISYIKSLRGSTELVPVRQQGPGHAHEQDSVSLADEGGAVKEEGQVRSDHHHEALSEVPVPRVCTVKLSHVVQHVKL